MFRSGTGVDGAAAQQRGQREASEAYGAGAELPLQEVSVTMGPRLSHLRQLRKRRKAQVPPRVSFKAYTDPP